LLPDASGLGTEEIAEVWVTSRRGMSGPQVLDDYAAVSEQALAVLEVMAGVDDEMDLGDLGTYPVRVLPTAFCFDHYTHIRADLFAPRGTLRGPVPPSDELRLAPTLEWIEAAVPQQNRAVLESDEFKTADIVLSGIASRTIRIGHPTGPASATVRSDADALVRWITQRGDWQSLGVEAEGDPATLAVLRRIKVF
jgi:MDMPI C-terminal domain